MRAVLLLFLLLFHTAGANALSGRDGCFLLVRVSDGKVMEEWNRPRIERRFSPCSTFKVPVAAMAFERKILDERRIFVWDGKVQERRACNRNQTARSWMVDSVVWVTQQLTRELGKSTVQGYLAQFDYGNQDMSGGLEQAWLMGTLTISAREQVHFLRALWRNQLPLSPVAMASTRALIAVEHRWTDRLDGKTGTGWVGENRQLGWFVGHLRHAGTDYVFALNYNDRSPGETRGYAGQTAREMVKSELQRLHLWAR